MAPKLRIALASILAVAALGAAAPAANAYVYWANYGSNSIARANLDGTNAEQNFITGASYVTDLAVDANYIYWPEGGGIARASLNGGSIDRSYLTGLNTATKIAVYGDYVYYVNGNGNSIGRAALDRSSANNDFITGLTAASDQAFSVEVDSSGIYVTSFNNERILKWNLAGDTRTYLFDTYPSTRPTGIALRSPYLYTANFTSGSIGRGEMVGVSWNKNLVTGASSPEGVAVDSNYLYWSNSSGNTIGRSNLDGSSPDQSFITGANSPTGMAVDSLSPAGDVSPSSHDFGSVSASGGEQSSTFTINSSGNVPLTFEGMSIGGTDGDQFGILNGGTCVPGVTALSTWQSCTVEVNFAPSSAGPKSATLNIGTNAGVKSVALTGTGTVTNPTLRVFGTPTKTSVKVRVGCGDAGACSLRLTGKKVGTTKATVPKTVSVSPGATPVVTLAYSKALKAALARGGRVSVTATNTGSGVSKSIVYRVAR